MATSFPYAAGASIEKAIAQFRKSFPSNVTASTLKKFSIAPNNESYVISVLRFLDLIDADGNRRDDTTSYFYAAEAEFRSGFNATLRNAYKDLFDDFGDDALSKPKEELIPWFRATDKSSENVGVRQANTFITLVAIAGYGTGSIDFEKSTPNSTPSKSRKAEAQRQVPKSGSKPGKATPNTRPTMAESPSLITNHETKLGLTVRVEVNLPAGGDQSTYDAIFASIRKHLLD